MARIERLEARLAGTAPPAPPPRDPAEPATAAGRATGRTQVAVTAQVESQPPVAAATTLPGAPPGGAPEAQARADEAAAHVAEEIATEQDPSPVVAAVAVVEPDAPAPQPSVALSLEAFAEIWPAVLETLEGESPMLAEMLRQARPSELSGEGLTLAWPERAAFSKRQAEEPAKRDLIARSIRAVTGASLRLAHELREDLEAAPQTTISDDELVARFKAEFDAEELPPPTEGSN
jgi:DNA polymerase-3 subunit gamma/tau